MRARMLLGPAVLALTLLLGGIGIGPAVAADPLSEEAYAVWAGDHALRLLRAMELPSQFTLSDLRDTVARLGELADEARGVGPPPRYAAAHGAYLAGVEGIDRVRAALQTVVLTRQPVPELADALFDAGQVVASGWHQLRDAGIGMPADVLALLGMGPNLEELPPPGSAVVASAPPRSATASPAARGSCAGVQQLSTAAGTGSTGSPCGRSATSPEVSPVAAPLLGSAWASALTIRVHRGIASTGRHAFDQAGQCFCFAPASRFRSGGRRAW